MSPSDGPLSSLPPQNDEVHSVPSHGFSHAETLYRENVTSLACRIVDAQRPLRVLNSLRWDPKIDEAIIRGKCRDLPAIGPADYVDVGFDTEAKRAEFEAIATDVTRVLSPSDPLTSILETTALEYRDVIRMLECRGTQQFYEYSKKLYGSPQDRMPGGHSVREICESVYNKLGAVGLGQLGADDARVIGAEEAANMLRERFRTYFVGTDVQVQVDDTITADAAAGSDYVKIRSRAKFSQRDIDILEVHEGWVHVATSLNGQAQPIARWLSKGPPRTIAVQEGLAALVEIFTFRSSPRRARRINDRVLAVELVENGANFADAFEWFRSAGYNEEDCFVHARRIFRGGTLEGGAPFTKDALYGKGIVLNYAFLRSCILTHRAELIPFLFVGKLAHEDVPALFAHSQMHPGFLVPPLFVPNMFRDRSGLAAWVVYADFLTGPQGGALTEHFDSLLQSV